MAKAKTSKRTEGVIFNSTDIVRADGTIVEYGNYPTSLTLDLSLYIDDPARQDPDGEYYNAGVRILLENLLGNLYSGLKYNSTQVSYHQGKVDSIQQVHVERQEQDMLGEDPRFIDHAEQLKFFDDRAACISGNIQEVKETYFAYFASAPIDYKDWLSDRNKGRRPATPTTKTGTVDPARAAAALAYVEQKRKTA